MKKTKIEWCDHTFNPWIGCTKISSGCKNCYASKIAGRFGMAEWGDGAIRVIASPNYWLKPLAWNRLCGKKDIRDKVFCGSMCDIFDKKAENAWRDNVYDLIKQTPNLDWLLLTKRAEYMKRYFDNKEVPENAWLGVSVENDKTIERINTLTSIKAKVRFVSCEPLLSEVILPSNGNGIHWVICGCESGHYAREAKIEWIRSLRDQCKEYEIPFFLKQMRVGGRVVKMPKLDGVVHAEFPNQ